MLVHLWWFLAMACLVWYVVMTVYVGIRGAFDIRTMLRSLAEQKDAEDAAAQR